jgi:hypothetical protein
MAHRYWPQARGIESTAVIQRVAAAEDAASRFRVLLLLLGGVSLAATGAELAVSRHWDSGWQLVPWGAVGRASSRSCCWRPVRPLAG